MAIGYSKGMHSLLYLAQAAGARVAAEPHSVTYVDFLTVTLTAMCVLLAALGFIVAIVAIIGYRDIKASSIKAAKAAAEAAIESKLKEYPDAAQLHARFSAMDRYMGEFLRKERLLAQVRAAPSPVAKPSKEEDNKPATRPRRYPKKGD